MLVYGTNLLQVIGQFNGTFKAFKNYFACLEGVYNFKAVRFFFSVNSNWNNCAANYIIILAHMSVKMNSVFQVSKEQLQEYTPPKALKDTMSGKNKNENFVFVH